MTLTDRDPEEPGLTFYPAAFVGGRVTHQAAYSPGAGGQWMETACGLPFASWRLLSPQAGARACLSCTRATARLERKP